MIAKHDFLNKIGLNKIGPFTRDAYINPRTQTSIETKCAATKSIFGILLYLIKIMVTQNELPFYLITATICLPRTLNMGHRQLENIVFDFKAPGS